MAALVFFRIVQSKRRTDRYDGRRTDEINKIKSILCNG